MGTEEIFTIEEVSKQLRVPEDAVWTEIKNGRLRAMVVGGEHYRIREGDLWNFKDKSYLAAASSISGSPGPSNVQVSLKPAPDFRQKWPDGKDELYSNVLEGVASRAGVERRIKLGFTVRPSSGKDRARTVVLVDRYPTVEFVGATEIVAPTDRMASIIRDRKKKQVEAMALLPAEYSGMPVGPFREVVDGPGSANGLAVICNASDAEMMVRHALIRFQFRADRA